jgi:hypothetical protein
MKVGTRLHSTVCTTTAVVVRPPTGDVTITCGGAPMEEGASGDSSGEIKPGFDQGTLLGKRYTDEESGLELLCTKGGGGGLFAGDRELTIKAAKALPASD